MLYITSLWLVRGLDWSQEALEDACDAEPSICVAVGKMWVLTFTVSQHLYNDKVAFVKACFIALGHDVLQLVHSIVVYRRLMVHTTVLLTVLRLRYNAQGVKKSEPSRFWVRPILG